MLPGRKAPVNKQETPRPKPQQRPDSTKIKKFDEFHAEPNKKDSWYGFHRFKKGYGGDLTEFVGTFDYVTDMPMYQIFKIGDAVRWKLLRLKAKLRI